MLSRGICSLCHGVLILALVVHLKASQRCYQNQFKKIYPNGESHCVDCPKCPINYGLSIKCGTTIPYDARIKCEYCSFGANFSKDYDYKQCLPCDICNPNVIATKCTRKSNTVCHHKCKSKQNFYDEPSSSCQKCSPCCDDGNDELQQDCLNNGMPRNQSCTVRQGKKCGPVSGKTGTHVPLSPTTMISSTSNAASGSTEKATGNPDNESSLLMISVGIFPGILFVLTVIIGCVIFKGYRGHDNWYRQKIFKLICGESCQTSSDLLEEQPRRNHEEQPPEVCSSQDNQVITGLNDKLFEWFRRSYENVKVREAICRMLDVHFSYAGMARYFKIEEIKVKWLIHMNKINSSFEPTENVLNIVESTINPSLCKREFLQCLDEINRQDVAEFLKNKFNTTTTNNAGEYGEQVM